MPGFERVLFGVFWIVAGLILTGLSYIFPIFDQYMIFYGMWIFGGLLIVWGLIEMAAWKLRGEGYRARRGARVSVQTLIDTMCFVALADGKIADEEVEEIHKILTADFGFEIDLAKVRGRVEAHSIPYDDFLNEVSMRSSSISLDFKHEIVRAALLVAFADGDYNKNEAKACGALVKNMGALPPQTIEMVERLFRSEPEQQLSA